MRISIFGLGYVGAVCGASLASRDHRVIGVDVSDAKVDMINRGECPIVEPGLSEMLDSAVSHQMLRATKDAREAIENSSLTMICVGTPSKKNGDLDLRYIEAVAREVGEGLRAKDEWHTVVIRSTVLPGTTRGVIQPIIEDCSGKRAGEDFGLAVNPEFLREGTAIKDYEKPPMTVIGEHCKHAGDMLEHIYADLSAPVIRKTIEVAEMIKYTCNIWHATKVSFANEIGNIAKTLLVDGREVMDVICQDKKLNISKYYMRPGFAFGGSCLPKDVRALTYRARQMDVKHPLLDSILNSNNYQVERAFNLIESYDKRNVAMLGLSFKAGTDDLRESPLVTLAEMLIGRGYNLRIFDRNVEYARVHGANKDYINQRIPHIASLMDSDLTGMLEQAEVIVLGNQDEIFAQLINNIPEEKKLLDLVGFMSEKSTGNLEGICW